MRLLFVIASIAIEGGGASKMLVWVANQFAKRGDDVYIYTHKNMNGPLFHFDDSIKLISNDRVGSFLYPFFIIKRIRKLMKRLKPDIVIPFMHDSNLYCMLANRFTHIPVVVCERTDPYITNSWKINLAKRLFFLADGAVFQLDKVADYYTWFHKPKVIIPNPILKAQSTVNKKFSERENEICNSARLDFFQKRQDILIKAFKIVTDKYPEMRLKLFGDGEDRKNAENLVESLGLKDKVLFMGTVKNPIKHIVESKLFVLSSDYEGISNSLTEAMAAGLTCISTDTSPGGARLLIEDGVNGLIAPCDNPSALAEKICFCLDNPEKSDAMGINAKDSVNRFSEDKIAKMWFEFIDKIANKDTSKTYQTS